MKKIFTILFVCLFSANSFVLADSVIPEWSEFCPEKFLNAEVKPNKYSNWNYLYCASIIGMPVAFWNAYKYYRLEDNNYWAHRKMSFIKEVQSCEQDTNRNTCYIQIRQLEENKTQNYLTQKNMENSNALQGIGAMQLMQINNNINNLKY